MDLFLYKNFCIKGFLLHSKNSDETTTMQCLVCVQMSENEL